MTAPAAAIMGDYVDLVFRKTRAVAIIHIEIPIEKAAEFVAAFGTPSQATGVPLAIARIVPEAASGVPKAIDGPSEHERRKWSSLPLKQQAAMRCSEPAFIRFMAENYGGMGDLRETADAVREFCGVKSRADILDGTRAAEKWRALDEEYRAWLRV